MDAISINNLSYSYPDNTPALKNISFSIAKRKKLALLGANGSGKSTLLQHFNGLFFPQTGQVTIMGYQCNKKNLPLIRKAVGIVFDNPDDQLFSTTVYDDVAFGPRNLGYDENQVNSAVQAALNSIGIADLAQRPPYNLSLGQKKKVAMAGVLAMEPEILVFDEPFSGLDPCSLQQFMLILEKLHQQNHTLIITTHDVDLAYSWADECIILAAGTLLAQGSTELLENAQLMAEAKLQVPLLPAIFAATPWRPKTISNAKSFLTQLLEKENM